MYVSFAIECRSLDGYKWTNLSLQKYQLLVILGFNHFQKIPGMAGGWTSQTSKHTGAGVAPSIILVLRFIKVGRLDDIMVPLLSGTLGTTRSFKTVEVTQQPTLNN